MPLALSHFEQKHSKAIVALFKANIYRKGKYQISNFKSQIGQCKGKNSYVCTMSGLEVPLAVATDFLSFLVACPYGSDTAEDLIGEFLGDGFLGNSFNCLDNLCREFHKPVTHIISHFVPSDLRFEV